MKSKLSLLIALCMLISMFSGMSFTAMAEGTGTAEDPIIITSQSGLEAIDDSVEALALNYRLGNNIILNSSYASISNFAGTFDGNGKMIMLAIDNTTSRGIFNSTTSTAVIKNLIVSGSITYKGEGGSGNRGTGSIAGTNNGTIENCVSSADVMHTSTTSAAAQGAGGITGTNNGTVTGCYYFGNVSIVGGYAGGIIGLNFGSVKSCGNYGTICKGYTSAGNRGGITGLQQATKYPVENCYNFGAVYGAGSVGGISGSSAGVGNSYIDCYNAGLIVSTNTNVGGINGYCASGKDIITRCYNAGQVGVGTSNGITTDYSDDNAIWGVLNAGREESVVTDCYYLGTASETAKAGTSPLTETAMKSGDSFVNWDFENTWEMGTGDYTYPVLTDVQYKGATTSETFPISTAEEFAQIANAPEGNYILTEDITLPSTYVPFGFAGVFDGNGKTITVSIDKGIEATADGSSNGAALFSYVYGSDVVIKNLTVDGSVKGYNAVAGIVGAIGKLDTTYSAVDTAITGAVTIENCVNKATITSGRYPVGGIVGDAYVGVGGKSVTIKGCTNYGTIVAGYTRRGGIAGLTNATVHITECANYGDVNGTGDIGGIVGLAYGSVTKCVNAGNISVGGIAGAFAGSGDVSDLFNIGAVGTAGIAREDMTGRTYTNCYTSYTVSDEAAAIIATKRAATETDTRCTKFSNCYYLSDSETSTVEGTVPLSADEMKAQSSFEGFDFENTWELTDNYAYPTLKSVPLEQNGSDELPYLIETAEDYSKLSKLTGKYILVNDITLTNHTPVAEFAGTFEGNGKTITINSSNGLFYSTAATAVVKAVTIEGVITNTENYTGGVAGINKGIIENCINNATVTGASYTGGITGNLERGSVINCVNKNSVSGTQRIGGIAGQIAANTAVSYCKNSGSVSGTSSYQGGIVGVNLGYVSYSVNSGDVNGSSNGHAGGIVGLHQGNKTLEFCYNTGKVKGASSSGTGGIAGSTMTDVTIENCYNTGDVISSHSAAVGGIVGGGNKYGLNVNKTYNIGNITAGAVEASSTHGIFGFNDDSALNEGATVDITNSYYLGEISEGAEGTAKTSAELSAQSTYTGWDFEKVWEFGTEGYTYPILKNVEFIVESGIALNPYVIRTQADFEKINNDPEAYYTLADDITLDSTYEPFAFAGKLEGNNHKITVAIDKGSEKDGTSDYAGIFTYIYGDAPSVKNLTIAGSVAGYDKAGALAGALGVVNTATINGEAIFENITNEAAVTAHNQTGGIFGDTYYGVSDTKATVIITGCVNKGVISGNNYTGGIVGITRKSVSVEYAANTADVTGGSYTGGIIGGAYGSVNKAYNLGDINGNIAGGIIGQATMTLECADLFNAGTVSGATSGGILGLDTYGQTVYTNCYNVGTTKEDCEIFGAKSNIMKDGTVNIPKASNCYYLSDETTASWEGTTPLTEAEMKLENSFNGFDFEKVWKLDSETFIFPALRNVYIEIEEGNKYAPISISNAEEFKAIAGSTKYYVLKADIDLSEVEYSPMAFSGGLDGNGHTITVALDTKNMNNVGIFSELSGTIAIKNLKLAGTVNAVNEAPATVSLKALGALAGNIASDTTGEIANIESSVAITYNQYDSVGGFVGNAYAPGIAVEYKKLINNGSITLTSNSSNNVGGIVGLTFGLSSVSDCINNADIVTANVAGGIVGSSYCNITNCINNGDISADDIASGIAANAAGSPEIKNCYNTGDIITNRLIDKEQIRTAGIMAYDASGAAKITNCYNIGAVVRENENYMNISGIFGSINPSKTDATIITNSYYLSDGEEEAAKTKAELEVLAETLGEAYETSTASGYTFPQLKTLANDVTISVVKISVADADNGTLKADREYAKTGSLVNVTAVPYEDYLLTSLKAGDAELIADEYGIASFVATADTTVSAVFTEDVSEPSAPVAKNAYTGEVNADNLAGVPVSEQVKLIGKKALLAFSTVSKGNSAYKLVDCGFVVSSADETPEIGEYKCYQVSSYVSGKLNTGAVVYGAPVDAVSDYPWFVVPYAIYETENGTKTIYGSMVEITPSLIKQ